MNDILLGTIIGGVVGVTGSAIVAWIQARHSERQQSKQIEHEKDSQLVSRRIAVRSRYLEPLTSDLCNVYICASDCLRKLVELTGPYYSREGSEEVKVPAVDKEEFIGEMRKIRKLCEKIRDMEYEVFKTCGQVADTTLLDKLTAIPQAISAFRDACDEALGSLGESGAEEDFVCDFEPVTKEVEKILLRMPDIHGRIESLLAGAE